MNIHINSLPIDSNKNITPYKVVNNVVVRSSFKSIPLQIQ